MIKSNLYIENWNNPLWVSNRTKTYLSCGTTRLVKFYDQLVPKRLGYLFIHPSTRIIFGNVEPNQSSSLQILFADLTIVGCTISFGRGLLIDFHFIIGTRHIIPFCLNVHHERFSVCRLSPTYHLVHGVGCVVSGVGNIDPQNWSWVLIEWFILNSIQYLNKIRWYWSYNLFGLNQKEVLVYIWI